MTRSHRLRHLLIYIVLGLMVVGAGLLAAYSFTHREAKPKPFAVDWKPNGKTEASVIGQIASHTQARYRLGDGLTLVHLIGNQPSYNNKPAAFVQIDSKQYPTSSFVNYEMCGDGMSCQLPGTASVKRGCVLTREAFELAYQTFRYISTANYVSVLTPFKASNGEEVALLYRRDQWGSILMERLPIALGRADTPLPSDSDACKAAPKQSALQHIAGFGIERKKGSKAYVFVFVTGAKQ